MDWTTTGWSAWLPISSIIGFESSGWLGFVNLINIGEGHGQGIGQTGFGL